MIEPVEDPGPAARARFDAVIDVRSPSEFAEDHLPGAINMPVLSDRERAEVGRIYVQTSKFQARLLGAALVSVNIAGHLRGPLADKPGSFHPLVYCWRGGQRSEALATVLSRVGWRVGLLQGGYRTYRRAVVGRLYAPAPVLSAVVLDGPTGTGKTALLARLDERGVQTLDLEGLAGHRGSLFGADGQGGQPSQKAFESRLLARLETLDPSRPTVIEGESSRIGALFVPPGVWSAMQAARRILIDAPAAARARYIASVYAEIGADRERLLEALSRLPRHHGAKIRARWIDLAEEGRLEALALDLIEAHYDPAYRRSAAEGVGAPLGRLSLSALAEPDLNEAAEAIVALLHAAGRSG